MLVANVVIWSGLIQRTVGANPEDVELGWARAYSPWPGRVYVTGLKLRLQDPMVQFQLEIEKATVDVTLWELPRKKFRASYVVAQGVRYRMLAKVDTVEGNERRLDAFPPIDGFAGPALRPNPPPPFPTQAVIDTLWSVQIDEVHADIDELWFLEYRYRGNAHVDGAFALSPLRQLWVGPALLRLNGGELRVGEHVLAPSFNGRAEVTIAPVDLAASPGLRVLHTLSATIQFETAVENLSAAKLYVDGLQASGKGKLRANVRVADGKLIPGTELEASFTEAKATLEGFRFTGDAHASLTVPKDSLEPAGEAKLSGTVTLPLPKDKAATATLSNVTAHWVLSNDLTMGSGLQQFSAVLGEAQVNDVRDITRLVGSSAPLVPLVAPLVLGDGPLLASATMYATPEYTLVRLKQLTLGDAAFEGAAVAGANGWSGALAGRFGKIPLGFRLRENKLESVLFAPPTWLGIELLKAGIKPDLPAKAL
jgi:hypothetical protein